MVIYNDTEETDEITTIIYQKDAAMMLELLYGDI